MLYNLKNHEGAWKFLELRETEAGTIATVQFIGAPLPISADPQDLTPYTGEAAQYNDPIATLAQRAAIVYKLDPARINRACNIIRTDNPPMIREATEHLRITSSNGKKSYRVAQKSCDCYDSQKGNICKHRIAAWMYRELHPEPEYKTYAMHYCMDCLREHWMEITRYDGDKCHGEAINPLHIPQTYARHIGGGYYAVTPITHPINLQSTRATAWSTK